ncbi:hypothetical protein [Halomarina rubra]|uniref:Uncharacterized protein n=1 Tax=Halomarina rubra TaxID=2071873 RepID=A0ABD6B088_9EURY|nr:hypothetical protein [Halomarina rubra]
MPSRTDATGDVDETDDPVYRWVRAFGTVLLAFLAYLVILGPVVATVLGLPPDAASAVGPATDRTTEGPADLLRENGALVLHGLPTLAAVGHVALGVRLRPLGLFVLAQVCVGFAVLVVGLLLGGLTGGGVGLPGTMSLAASYLVPLWYVRRDRSSAPAGATPDGSE